ncbi:MAG: hypothetical protein ABI775_08945 [Pseudonocardiales bacterium]
MVWTFVNVTDKGEAGVPMIEQMLSGDHADDRSLQGGVELLPALRTD